MQRQPGQNYQPSVTPLQASANATVDEILEKALNELKDKDKQQEEGDGVRIDGIIVPEYLAKELSNKTTEQAFSQHFNKGLRLKLFVRTRHMAFYYARLSSKYRGVGIIQNIDGQVIFLVAEVTPHQFDRTKLLGTVKNYRDFRAVFATIKNPRLITPPETTEQLTVKPFGADFVEVKPLELISRILITLDANQNKALDSFFSIKSLGLFGPPGVGKSSIAFTIVSIAAFEMELASNQKIAYFSTEKNAAEQEKAFHELTEEDFAEIIQAEGLQDAGLDLASIKQRVLFTTYKNFAIQFGSIQEDAIVKEDFFAQWLLENKTHLRTLWENFQKEKRAQQNKGQARSKGKGKVTQGKIELPKDIQLDLYSKNPNLDKINQECRAASLYEREEDYYAAGQKKSLYKDDTDAKSFIYHIVYKTYRKALKDQNKVDLAFAEFETKEKFALVVADESQLNTPIQRENLLKSADNLQVCFCVGRNQQTNFCLPTKYFISKLFEKYIKNYREENHCLELTLGSYRSPAPVCHLGSATLRLKFLSMHGLAEKGEAKTIPVMNKEENPSPVHFITEENNPEVKQKILQLKNASTIQHGNKVLPDYAVLIINEKDRSLAESYFEGTPLIYTPDQIIGCPVGCIFLFHPLNDEYFARINKQLPADFTECERLIESFNLPKEGAGEIEESNKWDKLISGLMRSTKQVVVMQPEWPSAKNIMRYWLQYMKQNSQVHVNFAQTLEAATEMQAQAIDWLEAARKHIEEYNIFHAKKILSGKDAGGFTDEQVEKLLQAKLIEALNHNKKDLAEKIFVEGLGKDLTKEQHKKEFRQLRDTHLPSAKAQSTAPVPPVRSKANSQLEQRRIAAAQETTTTQSREDTKPTLTSSANSRKGGPKHKRGKNTNTNPSAPVTIQQNVPAATVATKNISDYTQEELLALGKKILEEVRAEYTEADEIAENYVNSYQMRIDNCFNHAKERKANIIRTNILLKLIECFKVEIMPEIEALLNFPSQGGMANAILVSIKKFGYVTKKDLPVIIFYKLLNNNFFSCREAIYKVGDTPYHYFILIGEGEKKVAIDAFLNICMPFSLYTEEKNNPKLFELLNNFEMDKSQLHLDTIPLTGNIEKALNAKVQLDKVFSWLPTSKAYNIYAPLITKAKRDYASYTLNFSIDLLRATFLKWKALQKNDSMPNILAEINKHIPVPKPFMSLPVEERIKFANDEIQIVHELFKMTNPDIIGIFIPNIVSTIKSKPSLGKEILLHFLSMLIDKFFECSMNEEDKGSLLSYLAKSFTLLQLVKQGEPIWFNDWLVVNLMYYDQDIIYTDSVINEKVFRQYFNFGNVIFDFYLGSTYSTTDPKLIDFENQGLEKALLYKNVDFQKNYKREEVKFHHTTLSIANRPRDLLMLKEKIAKMRSLISHPSLAKWLSWLEHVQNSDLNLTESIKLVRVVLYDVLIHIYGHSDQEARVKIEKFIVVPQQSAPAQQNFTMFGNNTLLAQSPKAALEQLLNAQKVLHQKLVTELKALQTKYKTGANVIKLLEGETPNYHSALRTACNATLDNAVEFVQCLLKYKDHLGINVNNASNSGLTALDVAISKGNEKVIAELKKHGAVSGCDSVKPKGP